MALPHIRLEGDVKQCLVYLPEAKQLLRRLEDFSKNAEAAVYAQGRRIGDRGYMYVRVMPGLSTIFISVDAEVVDEIREPDVVDSVPSLPSIYSGAVGPGAAEVRDDGANICDSFAPTTNTVRRYPDLSFGFQKVPRLGIKLLVSAFPELDKVAYPITQYAVLRPTMYSGLMSKVVQAVMGLGVIDHRVFGDSYYARFVERSGVQIQYDYKFYRCHGVVRAQDGQFWLVEISMVRGVVARKLPLIPGTELQGYRDSAEARNDTAIVELLDTFGGVPSGESIPLAPELVGPMIEDGTVLELLSSADVAGFYANSPYSIGNGWSFSPTGHEAHNTGWRYGDDGYQRSAWYQISFNFSGDNGSATITMIKEGVLFAPATRLARYIPFKIYDPDIDGLLSHDGRPNTPLPPVAYDTVVHVAFIGGNLHTVSYYYNPNEENENIHEDETIGEDCLINGEWTITNITGLRYVASMMYTTVFDDRQALAQQYERTVITSTDAGYNAPQVGDFPEAPAAGMTSRSKAFKRRTHALTTGGERVASVVAVPQYSRDTYYHAFGRYWDFYTEIETIGYNYVLDPNVYFHWRCFPSVQAFPWPTEAGCEAGRCGGECSGGTGSHTDRKVVCEYYLATPCSEYADSGPWLSLCDGVDSLVGQPQPVRPTYSNTSTEEFKTEAELKIASTAFNGPFTVRDGFAGGFIYESFERWERPSPDPDTGHIQRLRFVHNAMGPNEVVLYEPDIDYGFPTAVNGNLPPQVIPNQFFCFVGVLNDV